MSKGKYQKPLVGAKFDESEVDRIDRRWRELGLPDRSAYVRSVVWKDLNGAGAGGPALRSEVEAVLAPAIYVLLSCMRRVETSGQALAVVERVYLSGDANREIEQHMARGNAEAMTAEGVEP